MENLPLEKHVTIDTQTYFEAVGGWPASRLFSAYLTGFILSLIVTFVAYVFATHPVSMFSLQPSVLITTLAMLALVQFVVQLFFFFHFSKEKASRERLWILLCTLVIVGILVSGSLWIMYSLDARMMPSQTQMEQYMNSQIGL